MQISYSKILRQSAIARRITLLVVIAVLIGFIAGWFLGYVPKTFETTKDKLNEKTQVSMQDNADISLYRTYGPAIFREAVPFEWSAGNSDFTPIDCEICELTEEIQQFIYYICRNYHVDFALVLAVIKVESGFEIQAVSPTNDYGLMQINQMNHSWLTKQLGTTDYLNPYQNVYAGVYILRMLFEKYNDVNRVLMAYNMGETGASRLWETGIYETDYTREVLAVQQQFSDRLEGE